MLAVTLIAVVPATAEYGIDDMFKQTIDRLFPGEEKAENRKTAQTESTVQRQVPTARAEIQLSFAPLVKKVSDSVVNVYGKQRARNVRSPFAGDPIFERFFGVPQRRRGRTSVGSGIIVSDDGVVLTNNHVIEKMDTINIVLADGREFECEILLTDKKSDLAVLKAKDASDLQPIEIGDSEDVEVGDLVLAIGNPFGVGQTVTSGIVSAVSRTLSGVNDYGFFIQTDASINPGNSGGALVDMQGRLIGVNTMIFSKSGGSVGIGYAVPANMARVVLNSARTGDKVTRPWIGASFQNVTSDIAESLGMRRPRGALVVAVTSGSPAEDADLKIGDVVLRVNDRAVNHPDALGYRLDTLGVGNKATVHVLTRGERRQIQIALVAPPEDPPRDIRDMPEGSPLWGAKVANVSPALTQEYSITNIEDGVVVLQIGANSPASFNGIRPRDVVREVNGTEIKDTRHLQRVVSKDSHSWQFVVERGGEYLVFERRGGFLRQYRR